MLRGFLNLEALKTFVGKKEEEGKTIVSKELYHKVNNALLAHKEYAPSVKSMSALLSVPEKVAWSVILALGKDPAKEWDDIERELMFVNEMRKQKGSWREALAEVSRGAVLVYDAIDEDILKKRTPMEKANLYTDRVEDTPIGELLMSEKGFSFNSLWKQKEEDGSSLYHAVSVKKYAMPKDNGEVMSFILSMTDRGKWADFVKEFLPGRENNLIGAFKIEEGALVVEVNGREMSYSKAMSVFPELSLVVQSALKKAQELGIAVEKSREMKAQPQPSRRIINSPGM